MNDAGLMKPANKRERMQPLDGNLLRLYQICIYTSRTESKIKTRKSCNLGDEDILPVINRSHAEKRAG